jgi:hypothetical protein
MGGISPEAFAAAPSAEANKKRPPTEAASFTLGLPFRSSSSSPNRELLHDLRSVERSSIYPDAPTLREQGLSSAVATGRYDLMVPVGTSRAIVDRLQEERLPIPTRRKS